MTVPFVITGCGNSGTLFIARVLTDLGVRTAFEEYFTAYTLPSALHYFAEWLSLSATDGESSSLAAPYATRLEAVILHQVRHPIAVIRSLIGRETFKPHQRLLPNVRFFFRHLPEADHEDSAIILAMKYWVYWNRMAARRAAMTYQVERILDALPSLIGMIGASDLYDRDAAIKLLAKYGTNYHAGAKDDSIDFAGLPDGKVKDALVGDAAMYGYDPEQLESE